MYFNKNKKYKTEKCGAKDLLCAYYPLSSLLGKCIKYKETKNDIFYA